MYLISLSYSLGEEYACDTDYGGRCYHIMEGSGGGVTHEKARDDCRIQGTRGGALAGKISIVDDCM